jgi:hypothetical protein
MKKLIIFLLALAPAIAFSQGMKIIWEDTDGREFSINTHTGNFQYSMIAGDKLSYNGKYDAGPEGSVKSVGSIKIYYNGKYDSGPEGSIKAVGGLKISYNGKYDAGPEGTIKITSGSVNR